MSEIVGSSAVVIREACIDDVPALRGLMQELGYDGEETVLRRNLGQIGDRDDTCVFVAVLSEAVVGLAGYHDVLTMHRPGRLGRITSMVVTETARGQGIGSALVEHIKSHARVRGCEQLEVTSAERRTATHAYYQARGFDLQGRRFTMDLS